MRNKTAVTFVLLMVAIALVSLMYIGIINTARASDIEDAEYLTVVTIDNEGSSTATYALVPFDIDTAEMIAGGMLSADGLDIVAQNGAGEVVAVMPSINDSYNWMVFVESIGADSHKTKNIYTKGVTGGDIVYCPAPAGMLISDHAQLEPGDDFEWKTTVFVDWAQVTTGANLTSKGANYWVRADSATENWTATILDTGAVSYTNPDSHNDVSSSWSNETQAYDDNTGNYASSWVLTAQWGGYCEFTPAEPLTCNAIRTMSGNGANQQIDIDAYYNGAWNGVYAGGYSDGVYRIDSLGGVYTVEEVRVRYYNGNPANQYDYLYEIDFQVVEESSVTVAGVGDGRHDIAGGLQAPFHWIAVDATNPQPPVSDGLEMNVPSNQEECEGSTFTTIDNNAYTVTVTNALHTTDGHYYDGDGDYLSIADGGGLDFISEDFTIVSWIYLDSTVAANMLFCRGQAFADGYYFQLGAGGRMNLVINRSGGIDHNYTALNTILADTWYMVATVRDGTACRMYRDDTQISLEGTASIADPDTSARTPKLGIDDAGDYDFSGYTDMTMIFSRALTGGEIGQIYDATKSKHKTGDIYTKSTVATIPNNSDDIIIAEGGAVLYMETANWTVNDTCVGSWDFELAETFTDDTGNGHAATPSIRASGTHEDLVATITSQSGLITGSAPSSNVTGGWTLIENAFEEPEGLFVEGSDNYSFFGLDIGANITGAAEEGNDPPEVWHFAVALVLAGVAIVYVLKTTHSRKWGRKPCLVLAWLAGGVVLVFFYRQFTLPGLVLVPYGLIGLFIILWKKSPAPVD